MTAKNQNKLGDYLTSRFRRVALFLTVLALGGLASLAKTFELFSGFIIDLEVQVGGDMVLHLIVAIFLGFSACWSGQDVTPVDSDRKADLTFNVASVFGGLGFNRHQALLIMLSMVLVSVDEALQYFVPTRTFSPQDWFANMIGLTVGIGLHQLWLVSQTLISICKTKYKQSA